MPRQDVPYGGALCRIRERIAEIFDLLGEKLHSINGVEGDGQGDISLVSGDAAVVITNDALQNEIEISLDTSQLPAASVASVNGQTGAVALTADDIPSDNGDVQTDIDNLEAADTTLQGNINAEALARQNADSTLQTNINTVTASLPSAAAAAVAADPTVAQLVTDMAGKVDITDVSTVETPNTIAKRNGSGRLVAEDPASGATDKTLTTANWISQTGSGAPNNLIHRSGNESRTGSLRMFGGYDLRVVRTSPAKWAKIATLSALAVRHGYIIHVLVHSYNSSVYADFNLHIQCYYGNDPSNATACFNAYGFSNINANLMDKFKLCRNVSTGYWELYMETFIGATVELSLWNNYNSTDVYYPQFITFEYTEVAEPVIDADITFIYTPTPMGVIL